jgi:hypothetical protein
MSQRTTKLIASAAAAASLLGVVGLTASSASAATHRTVTTTATTQIRNRPDSGGNGYWANDKFTRVLSLTYQGKATAAQIAANPALAATPYAYTAQLSDKGTFLDMPGQYTPNQSGHNLGKILRPVQVGGSMTGTGYFAEFFTSARANSPHSYANLGVEIAENDHGVVTGPNFHSSGLWPELAFPAGTVFASPAGVAGPPSEIQFGYLYTVPAYTTYTTHVVNGKVVKVAHVHKAQTWEDASWNSAGQLRADGNITGR